MAATRPFCVGSTQNLMDSSQNSSLYNPTWFHESHFKTSSAALLTDRQTNTPTDGDDYITFLRRYHFKRVADPAKRMTNREANVRSGTTGAI